MNTKTMAILAGVIIVVAAVGCAAYFMLKDDSPDSDYTLLDSDEKIQKGLTVKENWNTPEQEGTATLVVDSVSEGKVKYHISADYKVTDEKSLSKFAPTESGLGFDYTGSELPSGVSVAKDGTTFKITGTYEDADSGNSDTETYDLTIVYDGSVKSVKGEQKSVVKMTYGTMSVDMTTTSTYSTSDSKVVVSEKIKGTSSMETEVSEFYSELFDKFDADDYTSLSDPSEEKYGNVTATVYTVNDEGYKDYKIYTYKGYILKESGFIDGEKSEQSIEIYLD